MQGKPCDLSSTISTGSLSTSETLDVSPGDTGRCLVFVVVLVKGKLGIFFIAEWV